jgi:hypothetical protein
MYECSNNPKELDREWTAKEKKRMLHAKLTIVPSVESETLGAQAE